MTQIILIRYDGEQLSDKNVAVLAQDLRHILSSHASEDSLVDIQTLTEEELIERIRKTLTEEKLHVKKEIAEEQAIEHSIVYIGEKFKQFLTGPNVNYVGFVVALTEALHEGDNLLKKSAKILSTHSGKVKINIARKYGFTKSIFEAIAQVYSCLN